MDPDREFFSTEFLLAFIEKYRSLHCLWKVGSPEYLVGAIRQNGWEELTSFCRKRFYPGADIPWVKRKLQNIRGSFRKEMRKVEKAAKAGQVYKPKLWYYDHLKFIKDEDAQGEYAGSVDVSCNADDEDQQSNYSTEGVVEVLQEDDSQQETSYKIEKVIEFPQKKRKRYRSPPDDDEIPQHEPHLDKVFEVQEDDYDAVGKIVASKLRRIAIKDYSQFLFADKLITDVLFKGFFLQLSSGSSLH